MTDSVSLLLPWPPSVNHYWHRSRSGGMFISAKGRAFRDSVVWMCKSKGKVEGRVSVTVEASPPDRRKRDLDNICKALLDGLTHAGVIEDDCCIDDLHIRRCDVKKDGSVFVRVMRIWEKK